MKKNFNSLFEYYGFTKEDEKENPVISSVLKKLTPKKIEKEVKAIQGKEIPDDFQVYVEKYNKVGKRNEFIWKWLFKVFKILHLPTISKHERDLVEIKVLLTVFIALVDDVADESDSKVLLDQLLKIPFQSEVDNSNLNKEEKEYFNATLDFWEIIIDKAKKFPKFKNKKEIFDYDVKQLMNAMEYSYFVNKNTDLINMEEAWEYLSYNMNLFVYSDLDLMCSSGLKEKEGKIREIIYYLQKMVRVGNWVSTWEREIKEKDYTSGIVIHAISNNIINNLKDISKAEDKIRSAGVEKKFLIMWEGFYNQIKNNIDIETNLKEEILGKIKRVMTLHLISKNYK